MTTAGRPRLFAWFCLGVAVGLDFQVQAASEPDWQSIKTKHVVVYYRNSEALASELSGRAERLYGEIATALGFRRHQGFWLWENRATIRLYADRPAFAAACEAPPWAVGKADYRTRTISSYEGSQEFLNAVLPHEMGHLVFREFVGDGDWIPLWLDEGVAQWMEDLFSGATASDAAQILQRKAYTLRFLTSVRARNLKETKMPSLFYIQSASLVRFMVKAGNSDSFEAFCRHLRDGKTVEDALRFTYPNDMRTMDALESAWRDHVMKGEP